MSPLPYRIPESAPDYEADDINDALRAAAERHPYRAELVVAIEDSAARNAACADNGPADDVALQLAADDAEAARIEAERVPCAKCRIYTVAAPGDTCRACDDERWGERCDFNDDGHEVTR
jgi:hypothetical protein